MSDQSGSVRDLEPEEVARGMQEGRIVLVDVRELNETAIERYPDAVIVPLSAFERSGYFAGAEVSPAQPRLVLAAPALRIHPANETVLRYLSPEIEWELIALAEQWRRELKIVFRKRSARGQN